MASVQPKLWTPPVGRNINRHLFIKESRMAHWFGEPMLRMLQEAAVGLHCAIPVMYTPDGSAVYAAEGLFVGAMRGGGFTSLSDLIAEATAGKRQDFLFTKVGVTGVAGASMSLWRNATLPLAGAAAAALPGGAHLNNLSLGAPGLADPTGGDTLHLTTLLSMASVVPNLLMLYDRLWEGLLTTGTGAQTCTLTGYPNSTGRYSDAVGSKGNFAHVANESAGVLVGIAHTWLLVYTDDAGNLAQAAAGLAGISGCIVGRIDHPNWFIPLLSGDYGIQDIESIASSVNAQSTNFPSIVLGHPLALIPQLVANAAVVLDGINSAFNLVEFKTDCCPALLEVNKPATGAATYTGQATVVSG